MWKQIQIIQAFSLEPLVWKKKMRWTHVLIVFVVFFWFGKILKVWFFSPPFEILIRFIFFVCHLVDLSWYVRVCSLILMRYGTFLLALLINAFSPLSSPLVKIRLSWVVHLQEFGVLVDSDVLFWRMCQKLIMLLSFKVNHLELRYGKFLSYMVNWILHSWSVLHLLMHMLVRSIGELMIYHVCSLLLQWCRSIITYYFLILYHWSWFSLCPSLLWKQCSLVAFWKMWQVNQHGWTKYFLVELRLFEKVCWGDSATRMYRQTRFFFGCFCLFCI